MIKINLLPAEAIGKKRKERVAVPRTSTITVIIIIICYALVAGEAWWVYNKKAKSQEDLENLLAERDALKTQIAKISEEFKSLKRLKELAANQIEILNSLDPPNRLLWSEKINMMAELIPRNVYIIQLEMTEDTKMVITKESRTKIKEWEDGGKKGPKPPEIKKPVITQTLKISGITYDEDSEERLQRVVDFYYALKNFSWVGKKGEVRRFMDHFREEIGIARIPITSDNVAGVPVRRFQFILITKPITSM
jgi:hypothetical protein